MKIDLIAGARPNFVKIASLLHASKIDSTVEFRLIHTGQHYNENLSGSFFRQLQLPAPHINLEIGSGTQAEQTAAIMVAYEKVLQERKPSLCVVVGDVTSSMACAITAKKMKVKVAHVEAGIRSNDWNMPEEVNRVIIDSISNIFFTTTQEASRLLIENGKSEHQVHFVGNTMIDTLLRFKDSFIKPKLWEEIGLAEKSYIIVTLHRPGNVDEGNELKSILEAISQNSRGLPVIFPVHPRTATIMKSVSFSAKNFYMVDAISYLEFNYLVERAKAVVTDSGGVTEETTVMGIPCITIRENTERPETIRLGTNEIIGTNPKSIAPALDKLFNNGWKKGTIPEKWDGKSGQRIVEILKTL